MLEQVREQTRPAHLALEAQPLLKGLLSSRITEAEYGHLLQAMLAFYQSLESQLIPAAADLIEQKPDPDYRYQPRAPLLANDCRVLGRATSGFSCPPPALQMNGSEACLLGVLYVIEGATQGGRFIARHLADTLGVSEQSGAGFFNIHQWNHSWKAFRCWVGRDFSDYDQNDIKGVIEGADMTFTALHSHLDQWPLLYGN